MGRSGRGPDRETTGDRRRRSRMTAASRAAAAARVTLRYLGRDRAVGCAPRSGSVVQPDKAGGETTGPPQDGQRCAGVWVASSAARRGGRWVRLSSLSPPPGPGVRAGVGRQRAVTGAFMGEGSGGSQTARQCVTVLGSRASTRRRDATSAMLTRTPGPRVRCRVRVARSPPWGQGAWRRDPCRGEARHSCRRLARSIP